MGKEIQLYSPSGKRIIGTAETIPGVAAVAYFERGESGELVPVHGGGTDVFWDGQETMLGADDQIIVVDEDDVEWSLAECEEREEEVEE